eukprot:TRINITY_DN29071_c0_g1_i1.p1 TRINITY_DN29071_c0_g1~~TRINITY_DN29071_c0_g1_i1.p1  ORF type:complete len:1268 (+),score=165.26 TRINITY_DN29071_c0_g1_i1:246-4049(+)
MPDDSKRSKSVWPPGLNVSDKVLGQGASGEVYEGLQDEQKVAVKIVRGPVSGNEARKKTRDCWMREKRTALVLRRHPHRNILQYLAAFEVPEDRGAVCEGDGLIAMELGCPLRTPYGPREELLGPLVFRELSDRREAAHRAGRVAVSLGNALAHLHGVVKTIHRDVKPDNIVCPEDSDRICLCDFSAARTQMYTLQRATTCQGIGTMGFLAPEMYERCARYCSKVDIWAMGVTVLAYFNDGRPCSGEVFYNLTLALQYDNANADRVNAARAQLDAAVEAMLVDVLPDLEPPISSLRTVLALCLRAHPADRPSAGEMLQTESMLALARSCGMFMDDPPECLDLIEGEVEPSTVVAAMLHSLVERFDLSKRGALDSSELALVRDRLHRSLEEKDVRSLELMSCWLTFLRGMPLDVMSSSDDFTGRTLLHALVQSHRAEALLGMLEDHMEIDIDDNASKLEPMLAARDWEGCTALWLACASGTAPLACLRLLELRADVHAADAKGTTALERCASSGYERPGEQRSRVVTALIAFGARVPANLSEARRQMSTRMSEALGQTVAQAKKAVSAWQQELRHASLQRRVRESIGVGLGLRESPTAAGAPAIGFGRVLSSSPTANPQAIVNPASSGAAAGETVAHPGEGYDNDRAVSIGRDAGTASSSALPPRAPVLSELGRTVVADGETDVTALAGASVHQSNVGVGDPGSSVSASDSFSQTVKSAGQHAHTSAASAGDTSMGPTEATIRRRRSHSPAVGGYTRGGSGRNTAGSATAARAKRASSMATLPSSTRGGGGGHANAAAARVPTTTPTPQMRKSTSSPGSLRARSSSIGHGIGSSVDGSTSAPLAKAPAAPSSVTGRRGGPPQGRTSSPPSARGTTSTVTSATVAAGGGSGGDGGAGAVHLPPLPPGRGTGDAEDAGGGGGYTYTLAGRRVVPGAAVAAPTLNDSSIGDPVAEGLLSPGTASVTAESRLREHLTKVSHGHIMTAFRTADSSKDLRISPEEILHVLSHVSPHLVSKVSDHVHQYFSGGLCFREFSRWLRGHDSFSATANTRRHLEIASPAPCRPPGGAQISMAAPLPPAPPEVNHFGSSSRSHSNSPVPRPSQQVAPVRPPRRDQVPSPTLPAAPLPESAIGDTHSLLLRPSGIAMSPTSVRTRTAARAPERAAGLRGPAAANARLRSALIELFGHLDADGDGLLTQAELADGQRVLAECSGQPTDSNETGTSADDSAGSDQTEMDGWLRWTLECMVPVIQVSKVQLAHRIEAHLGREAA